ncbi:MAG: V-type ATP synthase subunit E family protein [Candidatus Bathyarchaeia archaeon]
MSEAVELIKSEIIRRAREESEKIVSGAEREAKSILSRAEAKAREVMMSSVKPEVDVMRRRILGSAMLEGRKMMLKAKNELVLNVLKAAEEKLRRIAEGKEKGEMEYGEVLFHLLKEAVSGLGEDQAVVSANRRDLSHITRNLDRLGDRLSRELGRRIKLVVADEPLNCIGGVIVKSMDGLKLYNNTLDGRLLKVREALKGRILRLILGSGEEADTHVHEG